jgi:5S rRNA maturation endonuclease (ribonuclease M5)
MHFFIDHIRNLVPSWRPASGGWLAGNCPVCVRIGEERPDAKQRGGFQFSDEAWTYHCFNCKFATGWSKGSLMSNGARLLLDGFGMSSGDIQRINITLMREQETVQLLNPIPEPTPAFIPVWPEVDLPKDSTLLVEQEPITIKPNFEKGLVMLSDRQLLHWTDWAYTDSDFKYRKRMLLPYRYNGKIVGHSARYIGTPPNSATPKYLLSKPPHYVFNLDQQKPDRKFVIVVEGDFDAISIDGVALGSNSLSAQQASLINQLKKTTILLPDADVAGNELIAPAIREGWAVAFPEWMDKHKDANSAAIEYGREFVIHSVLQSYTTNPTKIKVLAKKYLRGS